MIIEKNTVPGKISFTSIATILREYNDGLLEQKTMV